MKPVIYLLTDFIICDLIGAKAPKKWMDTIFRFVNEVSFQPAKNPFKPCTLGIGGQFVCKKKSPPAMNLSFYWLGSDLQCESQTRTR